MNYDRRRVQLVCESELLNQYNIDLSLNKDLKKLPSIIPTTQFLNSLKSVLPDDIRDYYFKGLLSFCEAIISFNNKGYSWATVKLYYSVFYFLRAEMLTRNTILVRSSGGGPLYRLTLNTAARFVCLTDRAGNSDHKGTIQHFQQLYKSVDPILSGQISGVESYDWLIERREQVNYRERLFHEPSHPSFWSGPVSMLQSNNMESLILLYLNDQYVYSFLPDHAIVSLPIKRLQNTAGVFKLYGLSQMLTEDQKEFLRELLPIPALYPFYDL